ncbi:MAG: hypothetical protein PHR81_08735 [Bacteroidales bacterium]|nr:hypothetical protein [Bacteroidales bacterium]MDD4214881.1 hypothetical protein [Bacteroidales bacterium]
MEGIKAYWLIVVFLIKLAAGVGMYFLYTYYYTDRATADIFKYFDDSKIMYDALWNKPIDFFKMLFSIQNDTPYFNNYYHQMNNWFRVFESNIYNDSHTIIRLNAVLRIFSFGYYNVHTVFMCFLSLTGLVGIYKFFLPHFINKRHLLFIAVFLIPSVLFWGSGVLKEGILLFGLGILLYTLKCIGIRKKLIINLIIFHAAMFLLIHTKFYIFIIVSPLLFGYLWCRKDNSYRCYLKYALFIGIIILAGINIHHIFPGYNAVQIIAQKQNDFVGLAKEMNSGSLTSDKLLKPELSDMILQAPVSFYNTLIRPYIFEAHSLIMIFAAIENMVILFLIIFCLVFARFKEANKSILIFCFIIVTGTFILTGITTPVIGAMVRYKAPALPFLLIFLFHLLDKEKVFMHLPFLRKFAS